MTNHVKLTEGNIRKLLIQMAIPASIGMFFNTMFNIVDTFYAGTVSTDALAALSISFPVFFILLSLTVGLSRGGATLVSYHIGKKDHTQAKVAAGQTIFFGALVTICIMTAGLTFDEPIFRFLGAEGDVLTYALEYIQTIFYGTALFVFSAALNSVLLAYGNSKALRNTLFVELVLNCILDPWFLYGGFGIPPLGITGIALATLVVKAVGLSYYAWLTFREDLMPTEWSHYRPQWKLIYKLFTLSFPSSLDMMSISLGFFITNYYIKNFGWEAIAAYGVALRIEQVFILPTIGFSIANLSITGQNYGAHLYSRIKESLRSSIKISMAIMTFGAFWMIFFPEFLISLFSEDAKVIAIGAEYLQIAALISWSYAISASCLSTLQGLHHPYYAIAAGFTRQFILRIPFFWWVVNYTDWGLKGIWFAILSVNWMITLVTVCYTRYIVRYKMKLNGGA